MVTTDEHSAERQDGETIPAYQLPAASVVEFLGSDQQNGLSQGEARQRLTRLGPNELESEPPTPVWRRLLAQFEEVLVILLIIAASVSFGVWVYEGDSSLPYEAMIIFAIVLINGILGYLQEARAERAVAALRAMTAATASITRDGVRQTISATELVPGDIILIDEGDAIPADARLLQSTSLHIVEASLTGESFPVSKRIEPIDQEVGLGDQFNMVFSGTTASYGRGVAIITATGMQTQIGRIAGLLRQTEVETTPLQEELDRTGKRLGLAVIVIAAVVVTTILFTKEVTGVAAIIDIFVFGVALAVAAVPEGLPAVVTAVLAIGVQRMARRNAIVRKLPAVETLGSATVIASDKTGTLTRNEMTVRNVVTASGQVKFSGSGYQPNGEIENESDSQQDK
ncbi:MAG: HAD-IC family P-type ATPase, partial [Nitrolancea sp.]